MRRGRACAWPAIAAAAGWLGIASLAGAEPAAELPGGPPRVAREDFQGKPPERVNRVGGLRMLANTSVHIAYRFTYRYRNVGNEVEMTVDSVETEPTFQKERSWWHPDAPVGLLDHEQGHVDLGWIYALEMRKALRAGLKAGTLKTLGRTRAEAEKMLNALVKVEADKVLEAHAAAHIEYDRLTRHGTAPLKQADARRSHRERLQELLSPEPEVDALGKPKDGEGKR